MANKISNLSGELSFTATASAAAVDGSLCLRTPPCPLVEILHRRHLDCLHFPRRSSGEFPYQPGYTAPPPRSNDTAIDISGSWAVAGAPLDLSDPHLLAMAVAERHLLESEYDEYADNNANGAAFCHSAALILMALLLLRHALTVTNPDGDEDDVSTLFSLFLLRAAGFLLPCYIMAWAISILQRRRQRQAGQHSGLQVTIAPRPSVVPTYHQEPPS